MTGEPEIHSSPSGGLYFPIELRHAESGKRDGVPWLAVTMQIGTEDAGYIPWYVLRCLN